MSYSLAETAVKFTRAHLTHLDPPVLSDHNLSPEMFIDF
jgi:hypothetical protein